MENYLLLKQQRKEIGDVIKAEGLQPGIFDLLDEESSLAIDINQIRYLFNRLVYKKDKKYYFSFDWGGENSVFFIEFCPGLGKSQMKGPVNEWQGVIHLFSQWINVLKGELEIEDPWGEEGPEDFSSKNTRFNNEDIFRPEEINALKTKIGELQKKVEKVHSEDEGFKKYIKSEFDSLRLQSEKMNKKDWMTFLHGILMNLIFSGYFSSPEAKMLRDAFSQWFGGLRFLN